MDHSSTLKNKADYLVSGSQPPSLSTPSSLIHHRHDPRVFYSGQYDNRFHSYPPNRPLSDNSYYVTPPSHPNPNEVNIQQLESGEETRTTVMIRNLPNKYRREELVQLLQSIVGSTFAL